MTTPAQVAKAFTRLVNLEIDRHAPLDYETIFEIAHDHVDNFNIEDVENLAMALADMLESARALR